VYEERKAAAAQLTADDLEKAESAGLNL
jgi:hypothetical protein